MSRPLALFAVFFLIAAADRGPLPHASGTPAGPGRNCGGAFTAARGDTLYSIARRCETTVAELVQENRLGRSPRLEAGQELDIPIIVDVRQVRGPPRPDPVPPPPSAVRPLPRLAAPPPPPPPPRAGRNLYLFQAGDTLYSLARWARTSLPALLAANPGIDARDIDAGTMIALPRGAVRPEPMRMRERGRPVPASMPSVVSAPPQPTVLPPPPPARPAPPPPRPVRPAPPPDADEADKPELDDEDEDDGPTPGGMDDGEPQPDGM